MAINIILVLKSVITPSFLNQRMTEGPTHIVSEGGYKIIPLAED
jgi:hypothetical protein